MAKNELNFFKSQLEEKEKYITELQNELTSLKSQNYENTVKLEENRVLQERELNHTSARELEKYKLEYENINSQKQEIETNFYLLQKENIDMRNRNTNLLKQKDDHQMLTQKLLDHLKDKIIEKHESNCALKEMCSSLTQNMNQMQNEHNNMRSVVESLQQLENAMKYATNFKCKSC